MLKWQLDIDDVMEGHFGTWGVELYSTDQERDDSPLLAFDLVVMPPCTLRLDTEAEWLPATTNIDSEALTDWLTTKFDPTDWISSHPSFSDSFCASLLSQGTVEDIHLIPNENDTSFDPSTYQLDLAPHNLEPTMQFPEP